MRILLDTHILIWAFEDNPRLSEDARSLINDEDNMLYYSDASIWEVALKHLAHPDDSVDEVVFNRLCESSGLCHLSIQKDHILKTGSLPRVHHDPFDRLLLAQAECEKMHLMTHDAKIAAYPLDSIMHV